MDHSSRHTRCRGATSDLTYWGGRSGNAPKRSGGPVAEGDREVLRKYPREDINHRSLSTPFIAGAIRYQKNKMKPTPIIWFHHNRRARGSRHARPSRLTRWMRRVPSCTLAKADCGVARYSGRRSPIGLCQNCVRMRSICVPQTDTTSCVPPVSGSHESRPVGTLGGLVPFPHFWLEVPQFLRQENRRAPENKG